MCSKNLPSETDQHPAQRDALDPVKPNWLWRRYAETPGLEVYRSLERYAVWSHHHQQLVKQDPGYRHASLRFRLKAIGCIVFACLLFLILDSAAAWAPSLLLAVTCLVASGILLVGGEQRRRNAAIARRLR